MKECIRCGTCCKKGGPSFHHEDKMLIDKGIIPSKYIYTIRKGERSYDNVKECFLPASSDILKLKGQKGSWTCIFFNETNSNCKIYEHRPIECKVLMLGYQRNLRDLCKKPIDTTRSYFIPQRMK